jgi:solute carrier family 13 (sodium-dependent dicarboxylate transporter), member 2/3/5
MEAATAKTERGAANGKRRRFRLPQWRRLAWPRPASISLGIALFLVIYLSPPWPDAVNRDGSSVALTPQGQAALALFVLACVWWVFEVIPIGVTSIAVGVLQAVLSIRPERTYQGAQAPISGAELAFKDFMHPLVWFVFGSVVIGTVLSKTGVTRRLAYGTLVLAGERTRLLLLALLGVTAGLTLVMAHTAVAATVYPLLVLVHRLYEEDERPTRFGKGLFIGTAFAASAGSVVTLLGSARAPVALGFFEAITGNEVTYFGLSASMAPVAAGMVLLLWLMALSMFPPERPTVPGLAERARALYARLGPMSRNEILALVIGVVAITVINLRDLTPALHVFDATTVVLLATVLFFLLRILDVQDLEQIPWNIILLFGGAMSLGSCLIETGAANWLAAQLVAVAGATPALVILVLLLLGMLLLTNVILNVATIALCLPVGLRMAALLGLGPHAVLFATLAVSGMPFLFLIGAAPNAIAFESRQFSPAEFFRAGTVASLMLIGLMLLMLTVVWPLLGIQVVVDAR